MRAFGDKKSGKNAENGTTETMTANSRLELGWGWSPQGLPIAIGEWFQVLGAPCPMPRCGSPLSLCAAAGSPMACPSVGPSTGPRSRLDTFFLYVPGLPSLSRSWPTITQPDRLMPGDECRVVVVVVGGEVVVVVGVDVQDSTFLVDQNEFTLSSLSPVYQIPHAIPPFPCSLDCNSWIRFLHSECKF